MILRTFLLVAFFMAFGGENFLFLYGQEKLIDKLEANQSSEETEKNKKPESFFKILEWEHLTDDWGGARSWLEDGGLSLEIVYILDVATNTSGGIQTGNTYLANLDLTLVFDTEKAGLWDGGTYKIYGLGNHGDNSPTEKLVGDLQVVSNIDAPESFHLHEFWYEQQLFDNKISILIGQHDLNSEFAATDYGALFLNSSFGIGPDISANVPLSIFPLPGLGIRLKLTPFDFFQLKIGVYEGDPGDFELNPHGFKWRLSKHEGAFFISEATFQTGSGPTASWYSGSYDFGFWYHSAKFEDLVKEDLFGPVEHRGNYGFYFVADQMVFQEKEEQGLALFFQIGGAPNDRNEVEFYLGGGLHYHGLIPTRDEDEFGVGVAYAQLSDKLRSREDVDLERGETTLEVTYKIQVTPWLVVQPDFQYVIDPGADPSLKNAAIGLLRVEIDF